MDEARRTPVIAPMVRGNQNVRIKQIGIKILDHPAFCIDASFVWVSKLSPECIAFGERYVAHHAHFVNRYEGPLTPHG